MRMTSAPEAARYVDRLAFRAVSLRKPVFVVTLSSIGGQHKILTFIIQMKNNFHLQNLPLEVLMNVKRHVSKLNISV